MATNDVFRFLTLRGVQKISPELIQNKFIFPTSENLIISSRGQLTIEEARTAAQDYFSLGSFPKNLGDIETPIRQIDNWLMSQLDRPTPKDTLKEIEKETGKVITDLIIDNNYLADRKSVYTTLLNSTLVPAGHEQLREVMLRGVYVFGLIEQLAKRPIPLKTSEDVFNFLTLPRVILPAYFDIPAEALSRTPSIADLKVVRQTLKRYEMGEIAHIENILKRESKERVHRRKDVREETNILDTEREESQTQELQKSERFELQQEASSVIKEDSHFEAGINISASYGPTVSVTANAGFETNSAKEESKRTSSTFARDVTERSAKSIREKTRAQKTTRSLLEIEETNSHGIDNKVGTNHIIGIYRYVDKIYDVQVFNYGTRLMLEFIVPEPASFIKTLRNQPIKTSMTMPEKPVNSASAPLGPSDIIPENYLGWAGKYFVQDIAPPPSENIWVGFTMENPASPDVGIEVSTPARKIYKVNQSLKIPADRVAEEVKGVIGVSDYDSNILFSVGGQAITFARPQNNAAANSGYYFTAGLNDKFSDSLPIGLTIENTWGFEFSMSVRCKLTTAGFQKWQFETYSKIIRAYFELKSMYEEQVAAAEIQRGVNIQGRNPIENRQTERTELKKHVIAMLEKQYYNKPPIDGEAIIIPNDTTKYPEVNFAVAQVERDFIQWFEQAFEWLNMTYVFYPYYWSNKGDWKDEIFGTDPDPLFNRFLQSGAARVVLPVRPGFESAMGLYLATGIIWNGSQVPQIGNPLFISAIKEIQEELDAPEDGIAEGKPWEVRLPTPLVILQETGDLPTI